jgi:hypothetical protein
MALSVHTLPNTAGAEVRNSATSAVWAHNTIGPAHRSNKVHAHIGVGEVSSDLQEALWELNIIHGKTMIHQ